MIRTSGRVDIVLSCTECKSRNYKTTKRREVGANVEEVTLKKFCKKCQKHTVHKETK